MIVFIDRQHAGKPNSPNDRGASLEPAPLFGMGKEAMYTGYLSLMIEEKLLKNGVKVLPISDGFYPDRHKRINKYSKRFKNEQQVYLALHLNSGGGDYASFFHMGSQKGTAWYTIKGVDDPIAICCEPLFMDTHRDLLNLESLQVIGNAIAAGIISWSL